MRPLFLDKLQETVQEFRKEAGYTHRLSEVSDNWSQEIGSELYKQLPFLSDYEVNVSLDKQDQGRGFAFGYADVSNRTERPELEHEEAGIPHIRIPIVAEERQVRPFSVFLDGERVLPMSEERVRETLFNPATFDLSNSVPRDPSLVEPLMPPQRSGIGLGGEYKMASASPEMVLLQKLGFKGDDSVKGGLADDKKKSEFDSKSLKKGQKVEEEHTKDKKVAKEIASDHLTEDSKYYEKLKEMEKKSSSFAEKVAFHDGPLQAEAKAPGSFCLPYPLDKFKGSPLLKKAIQIEKKRLALDKANPPPPLPPMSERLREKRNQLDMEMRELELELADWVADKTKVAYKHISDEQWKAIWKTDKLQQLLNKHGGNHKHPEIKNALYEIASKSYGYQPKVYPQNDEQKMKMVQKAMQKQQKEMEKQQKSMGNAAIPPGHVKKASLLEAIAPTIRESDRDRFVEKVASDPTIRAGFRRSGMAQLLVDVMDTKLASASDRLSALADSIEPSVVTFQKLPGGDFMVKSANVNAFAGGEQATGQVVPFEEVAEAIGADTAKSLQPGQVTTAVSNPVEIDGDDSNAVSAVSGFGEYKVQDADGKSTKGWVFPQLLSWDEEFTPQKTTLFLNGSSHAIQESLVGEKVESLTKIPEDIPKGEGVFRPDDGGVATAPLNIQYGMTNSQGVHKYVGTDSFGNEISVSLVPNLKEPKRLSENEYALPKDWGFTRLNKKVKLVSNEASSNLSKKVGKEKTSAILFYNGSFNMTGGCGLDKVASELRQDLDAVGAEFILGLLGVDGVTAKQKVAEARKVGFVKMSGLRTITLLSERFQESVKEASAFLSKLPDLRRDLIKEAAAIEDQGTVDKVLALNFINPENLSTFIEYLPELEETSERMAEMVLAGYLGMKEIPLAAVERSMHNMEEVVHGLKAVQNAQV